MVERLGLWMSDVSLESKHRTVSNSRLHGAVVPQGIGHCHLNKDLFFTAPDIPRMLFFNLASHF